MIVHTHTHTHRVFGILGTKRKISRTLALQATVVNGGPWLVEEQEKEANCIADMA